MAASTSGTKTANNAAAPHLPASLLTTLMAANVENLTVAQLDQLKDATKRIPGGNIPTRTLGSLFL